MRFAFVLPGYDPRTSAAMAREAEAAGWDGVFVPDALAIATPAVPPFPQFNAWVTLAAVAAATERITLGPLVCAVPRRRPWELAREAAGVDLLSGGRLVLPVGLGAAADDAGFRAVGEPMTRQERAARLNETLGLLDALWSGNEVRHAGTHWQVDGMTQLPTPHQRPRIPLWPVAGVGSAPGARRAARWDGVVPQVPGGARPLTPDDVRATLAAITAERGSLEGFECLVEPWAEPEQAPALVEAFSQAGATWWVESAWMEPDAGRVRARIAAGPPRSG